MKKGEIYYRTLVNLLHPAVLGAVIVGLIDKLVSYGGTDHELPTTLFSVAATVVLIWYFVLDYWVALSGHHDAPHKYKRWEFGFDVVVLTFLYAASYYLWNHPECLGFFIATTAVLATYLVRDVISRGKKFSLRSSYTRGIVVFGLISATPIILNPLLPSDSSWIFALRLLCVLGLAYGVYRYKKYALFED